MTWQQQELVIEVLCRVRAAVGTLSRRADGNVNANELYFALGAAIQEARDSAPGAVGGELTLTTPLDPRRPRDGG